VEGQRNILFHEGLPLLGEDHRMDIAGWLRGLGLEQYAPAFRDNDIDSEVLPKLTADDLISIGVTSVGNRLWIPKIASGPAQMPRWASSLRDDRPLEAARRIACRSVQIACGSRSRDSISPQAVIPAARNV
jgi:hypothetical protein